MVQIFCRRGITNIFVFQPLHRIFTIDGKSVLGWKSKGNLFILHRTDASSAKIVSTTD